MSTLSFTSLCKPFEQALLVFIDKISQEQTKLKKSDLIQLWNTGTLHDSSRIIIKEKQPSPMIKAKSVEASPIVQQVAVTPIIPPISLPKSIIEEKKESKPQSTIPEIKTQCIFRITRGDKAGEQCQARAKHDMFCVKHYKEPKDKKEIVPSESSQSQPESISLVSTTTPPQEQVKLKKKPVKQLSWTMVGNHRVITNTSVVVNEKNEILGYLENGIIMYSSNKEIEQVKKEYQLSFLSDDIDE